MKNKYIIELTSEEYKQLQGHLNFLHEELQEEYDPEFYEDLMIRFGNIKRAVETAKLLEEEK